MSRKWDSLNTLMNETIFETTMYLYSSSTCCVSQTQPSTVGAFPQLATFTYKEKQRETARNSETHLYRNRSRSSRPDRRACRSRCTCSVRTCRRARGTSPSSRVRSNPVRTRRDTYIPAWRSPSRPSPPSTRSARPLTAASSAAAPGRAGSLWAIKGYISIHNSR